LQELGAIKQVSQSHAPAFVKKIIAEIKDTAALNSPASFEVRTKGVVESSYVLVQLPAQYLSNEDKQSYIQFAFNDFANELKNNPNDAKTAYIMGVYLGQFGDYQNAANFFEKAVALSPNKQVLQISLANNYLKLGQKEKAIEVAKNAYELADGDSELKTKYDSLWIDYMRIVSVVDVELSKKLIDDETKAGRAYRVEMLLKKGIELSPETYQNYITLGVFYFQQGDKQKSLEILKIAKDKFPKVAVEIVKLISDIEADKNTPGNKY
jgi:tetratricopeptide (TPR) repeat protein